MQTLSLMHSFRSWRPSQQYKTDRTEDRDSNSIERLNRSDQTLDVTEPDNRNRTSTPIPAILHEEWNVSLTTLEFTLRFATASVSDLLGRFWPQNPVGTNLRLLLYQLMTMTPQPSVTFLFYQDRELKHPFSLTWAKMRRLVMRPRKPAVIFVQKLSRWHRIKDWLRRRIRADPQYPGTTEPSSWDVNISAPRGHELYGRSRAILQQYFETTPSLPMFHPTEAFSESQLYHLLRVLTDKTASLSFNTMEHLVVEAV